jgi:hypothetical protein
MMQANESRRATRRRIQVILPAEVANSLQEMIPVRQRSAFVSEAVEQSLMAAGRRRAIDAAFGAWRDKDYPLLNSPEDIEIWRDAIWAGEDPDEALRSAYRKKVRPKRAPTTVKASRSKASGSRSRAAR